MLGLRLMSSSRGTLKHTWTDRPETNACSQTPVIEQISVMQELYGNQHVTALSPANVLSLLALLQTSRAAEAEAALVERSQRE
jgi:hypothetical protein